MPRDVGFQVLAETGKQYAVYVREGKGVRLQIDLPAGKYEGEWLDVVSGRQSETLVMDHPGGVVQVMPPGFAQDCALRLRAK